MKPRRSRLGWAVRALVALAALVPLLTFVFPLWHYFFEAPQYPEGLAMQIWSYQLAGRVDLINGLNHYVGFMHLDAADFWELRVLPILVVATVVGGLIAAVVGTVKALRWWVIGYGAFAVAGMVDFYRWLYKFGHTVDPMAAIEMEGYTPPMLGTSVFMNFYITAWPGWGAYALAGGFVLGLAVLIAVTLRRRRDGRAHATTGVAALVVVGLMLTGCSEPKPATVVIGQDVGAFCGMVISDPRFAAQVVTKTGKTYKFDSIECMVAFLVEGTVADEDIHSAWVSDYHAPGTWLRADEARYLQSALLRSPMGLNLSAFKTLDALEDMREEANGIEVRYADLPGIVLEAGFIDMVHGGHGIGDGPDGQLPTERETNGQ